METAQLAKSKIKSKTGLTAANLDDDPPSSANMIDLTDWTNLPAPLSIEIVAVGSEEADLTGAWWYGYGKPDGTNALPTRIAPVNKGDAVAVRATAAVVLDVLEAIAGVYDYIGIGEATLSAGTLDLHARPLEVQR